MRIGATLTDSIGTLSPVDMFVETALSAIDHAAPVESPERTEYPGQADTAQFWIITTSTTPPGTSSMSMTPACAKPTPVDRRQDPRGDPGAVRPRRSRWAR